MPDELSPEDQEELRKALNWFCQSRTGSVETWTCRYGFVTGGGQNWRWGLWEEVSNTPMGAYAPHRTREEAQAKLEAKVLPLFLRDVERAMNAEVGTCRSCGEERPVFSPGLRCSRCLLLPSSHLRL